MLPNIPAFFYSVLLAVLLLLLVTISLVFFTDPESIQNRLYFSISVSLIFLMLLPLLKTWYLCKAIHRLRANEVFRKKFSENLKPSLIFLTGTLLWVFEILNFTIYILLVFLLILLLFYLEWGTLRRHRRFF